MYNRTKHTTIRNLQSRLPTIKTYGIFQQNNMMAKFLFEVITSARFLTLGGLIPTRMNSSGLVSGSSMTSRSSRICSPNPPISLKLIPPGSSLSMWNTVGSTCRDKRTRQQTDIQTSRPRLKPINNHRVI